MKTDDEVQLWLSKKMSTLTANISGNDINDDDMDDGQVSEENNYDGEESDENRGDDKAMAIKQL